MSIFYSKYENTFFVKVVWFSLRPCWEPTRRWSTVHPVKLIVHFSAQSNPCTTISPVWLAHYKAKYEVVLIGRFDYRRMCPVILTKRECIVPSWSRSVMNKVAWILMTKPTLRAILLVSRSWQKIRSCHFQNIIITMNMKGLIIDCQWNLTKYDKMTLLLRFCHIWLSFKETENLGSDISQKHSIFHVSWRRKNNFLSPAT